MNKYSSIIAILLFIISFSSCEIRDGVDECPEGDVRLNFYVEKFRNKFQDPLADRESLFCDRITHMRYFIYQNNILKEQGIIDTFNDPTIGFYSYDLHNLEFGDYQMIVVANSTGTALLGDPSIAENLVLMYQGSANTEDYFSAVFPFTVSSTEIREYNVGLQRTQGVVRYAFNNLPEDAVAVGVMVENVSNEKWITGDYKNVFSADHRYRMLPVSRQVSTDDYVQGTFPTVTGEQSRFTVGLYRDGENEPYLSQLLSDTLTVQRNQLLDLSVTYDNGSFSFEILMDKDWNGSSPGGEIGIQ